MSSFVMSCVQLDVAIHARRDFQIGTVLLIVAAASTDQVAKAVLLSRENPWVPVLIEDPPRPRSEIVLASMLLSRATHAPAGIGSREASVLRATRNRPLDSSRVYAYLAERCVRPRSADLLAAAIDEKPWKTVKVSRSKYYKELRQVLPGSLARWRLALSMASFAGTGDSLEQIGLRINHDPRTVRTELRDFMAIPVRTFRETVGWEWVVEIAMRRLGVLTHEVAPMHLPATGHDRALQHRTSA